MNYLEMFDALPDLLAMAKKIAMEQNTSNYYRLQDELREEYRSKSLPFRWSMPLRGFRHCNQCNKQFGQIVYELENPSRNLMVMTDENHLHAVREHDAEMNKNLKDLLKSIRMN